jgi:hydroxymethylbilane synthase
MPLAAHAVWVGAELQLDAALGDAAQPLRPLLRVRVTAPVNNEAAAHDLGSTAVAQLNEAGASHYLPAV